MALPSKRFFRDRALEWDSADGYRDRSSRLRFCSPAAREGGRTSLLATWEGLMEFLEGQGLALFWTALGEKMVVGGPGKTGPLLEFSRAYKLRKMGTALASDPTTRLTM